MKTGPCSTCVAATREFKNIEINKDIVGEKGKFLKENLEVIISFHNEKQISLDDKYLSPTHLFFPPFGLV